MRISIVPKMFIGFFVIIFMNVFFLVIVSKLENVNRISLILKRQNEVKNYMLRLKTLHRVRGPSVISYERVGLSESVQNFRDMHKKFTLLLDTIGRKIDTVLLLDSIVMHNTLYATQPGTNNEILKNAFNSIGIYNNIYASTFDSIVAYKNVPSAQKKISAWRGANNDADLRVASTIDSVENNIEQRTNVHIKDVEIQVKNVQNITWIIIIGVTLFGSIFALFFSRHITIALRRLKESASTIGKGDFDVAPTGYPNDEIGDLATAFFEMAVDLKNTQDELIKSKRLAAIGEVVASVNHEINNPLMIISGNAQFLEMTMEGYPPEMLERVRTILEETERISKVTRKLREIKNPVVEDYTSSGEQMINLDKSSGYNQGA